MLFPMADDPTVLWQDFGDGIGLVDGDCVRMLGIPFETRMTVIVLEGGGLWVHSPVALTPERSRALRARGPIEHLVAPATFHHLAVDAWREDAPSAKVWACPGLPARLPKRHFDAELGDQAPAAWAGQIDQVVFRGSRIMLEVVFFHRPSKTLIVTDIVQNHEPSADGWFWRTVKRLNAISAPNGGFPRDWRVTVRDREAARRCRDVILGWPFEQVSLTHGRCIRENAHAHIEQAFSWLQ